MDAQTLLGRDFEKGLARLKSLSEQPDSASSP